MIRHRAMCRAAPRPGIGGFSLLEVLVALSIMALSLGALYQAAGGGVRGVQEADQRTRALMLAQSLLDAHSVVPAGGVDEAGEEAGFRWRLTALPFPTGQEQAPGWPLYRIEAVVAWGADGRNKEVRLASLLPERSSVAVSGR